jgi:G3E family GTPase
MTDAGAMPIHIVTGFLGAGKTTLINRLLRAPELADTLVIVNEWGEIGLDHLLYEKIADDVILLPSGCLCCDLRGDLLDCLHDVLRRRDAGELAPFARIVLETSGLADPAPILHALFSDPMLARRTRLAGVTTLIDAVNGVATLEAHGEARRQVALADRIVLTKSDLVSAPLSLRAATRELNSTSPLVDLATDGFGAGEFLAEPIPPAAPSRGTVMSAHGASVLSRAFVTDQPIEAPALGRFLDLLGMTLGPRLLRVKGLVATRETPDQPLLIQGAQHVFHPPRRLAAWPGGRRETVLVVISDGLEPEAVERLWRALIGDPEIDQPDLAAMTENPLAPKLGGLLG